MSGRERYPLTSSYISACNARANASSPAVSKVALTAVILDDWKRDVSLNVSVVSLRTDLAVALSTSRSVLFHSDEGLHPFEPTGDAFDAFGCEGEALAGGGDSLHGGQLHTLRKRVQSHRGRRRASIRGSCMQRLDLAREVQVGLRLRRVPLELTLLLQTLHTSSACEDTQENGWLTMRMVRPALPAT